MLGARAPRHVYSAVVLNRSSIKRHITVEYAMPDGSTKTKEFDLGPQESKHADQELVTSGQMTSTGRIVRVTALGGNTLKEPFKGVNSPTKDYKFSITEAGLLE